MKIQELDLIEVVHQVKIGNKEEITVAILKKAEESDMVFFNYIRLLNYGLLKIWSLMK